MHLEIRTKRGHGLWAKKEQIRKVIDLPKLFNSYWYSTVHEITARGQLCPQPRLLISERKDAQRSLSLESMLALWNYISLQALLSVSFQLFIPAG